MIQKVLSGHRPDRPSDRGLSDPLWVLLAKTRLESEPSPSARPSIGESRGFWARPKWRETRSSVQAEFFACGELVKGTEVLPGGSLGQRTVAQETGWGVLMRARGGWSGEKQLR